jgi:hypothetical protein
MNILLLIVFAITFFITNVYENYFREKEAALRTALLTKDADKYGKRWHRMQWVNWFLTISFTLFLYFDFCYLFIALILFTAALWWILYDGALNSLRKRYFFFLSPDTTNDFEAFGNIYIKLIFLLVTIILLVIML